MAKQSKMHKRTAVRIQPKAPSGTPVRTLTRTLRYQKIVQLDNVTGTGVNGFAYKAAVTQFDPTQSAAWDTVSRTFEFWRLKRGRVYILPMSPDGSSTGVGPSLSTVANTIIWSVADFSNGETVSGVNILDYNNASFTTPSLNNAKKIIDTNVRLNQSQANRALLPPSTWIDTTSAMNSDLSYSGYQLLIQNYSTTALNLNQQPKYLLITELDVEFRQPGWQLAPTTVTPIPNSRPIQDEADSKSG